MTETRESGPSLDASYLEQVEQEAMRLAREAGAILLDHFRRPLDIKYKSEGRRDPVTQADRNSESFLREGISKAFPDHGIVGEEFDNSDHASPDFVWILDPLDGTNNFMNGLPVFACSIGVVYRGKPVVAAIFIPNPDGGNVYHARLGGGAFQDDQPLQVTENEMPERGRLTGLPSYYWAMYGFRDGLRRRIGEIRSLGSTVYEITMTARGTMQISLHNAPRVWDVAAGILLVQEAGGHVLTRRRGSQKWIPFESFGSDGVTLDQIYDWRAPILAGHDPMIRHVGERIWQRRRLWFRFRRWFAQKRAERRARSSPPGDATQGN